MRKLHMIPVLTFLIFSSLTILATPVRAENDPFTQDFSFNLYAPAQIIVNYEYTNNFSATNVRTGGRGHYHISGDPTSLEFVADDVDTYDFTMVISYEVPIKQIITIAIYSGSQPPHTINLYVDTTEIILNFHLDVSEEPHYPTAEEVAEEVVKQVGSSIQSVYVSIENLMKATSNNIVYMWAMMIFVAIIAVASLTIALKVRREAEWRSRYH